MQRIETQAQREAQEKRKVRYISYFLLFIMVFSTAGYAILSYTSTSPSPATGTTDSFGRSPLVVNGQTLYLNYPLSNVKNVSVDINVTLREYLGNIVYVSSENTAMLYELSSTLGTFVSKIQEACYGPCEKNLPEKNCSQPFIIINMSEDLSVRQENQCIFINGDIRSTDAFLYHLFETS